MNQTRRTISLLSLLGLGACSAPPGADADLAAAGAGAEQLRGASTAEPEALVSALTLSGLPRRCGNMRLSAGSFSMDVPEPNRAAIINHGAQIACYGPSGDFETNFTWSGTYLSTYPSVATREGAFVTFDPPLPYQGTPGSWPTLASVQCVIGDTLLSAPDFPSRSLGTHASATAVDAIRRSNGVYAYTVHCRATVEGPLTLTRDRPDDLIGTAGDLYLYACDLPPAERTSPCQNLCSQICTANLGRAPVGDGVSRCIESCVGTCVNGSECPAIGLCDDGSCDEELCSRSCTSTSQCGSNEQCADGCCLHIIR